MGSSRFKAVAIEVPDELAKSLTESGHFDVPHLSEFEFELFRSAGFTVERIVGFEVAQPFYRVSQKDKENATA